MRKNTRPEIISLPSANVKHSRELHPEYLSFTIDTSLVMGGHWWGTTKKMTMGVASDTVDRLNLADKRLIHLAGFLSPAMLRIGGTEADRLYYKPGKKNLKASPDFHEYVLKKGLWSRIHSLKKKAGFSLLFTVSAGLADRDAAGTWLEKNAETFIAWSVRTRYRVEAWEFGNEINGFPFIHGLRNRVTALQYSRDFAKFGSLVRTLDPQSRVIGPASAVWPKIGEPNPIMPRLCKSPAAVFLDALSWHWYPQQFSRGRIATRRAKPFSLLSARTADSVLPRIRKVRSLLRVADTSRLSGTPCEQWITETGHALYGGEPGLSDTFASTLWWLDALGLFAREGVSRVFRQSLVGSDYGLLDEKSFDPRPDYFASFIWKKEIGNRVYHLDLAKRRLPLRIYLHGSDDENGRQYQLLLINFSRKKAGKLRFAAHGRDHLIPVRKLLLAGESGIHSKTLTVNGKAADEDMLAAWGKKKTATRYGLTAFTEEETRSLFTVPPLCALIVSFSLNGDIGSQ